MTTIYDKFMRSLLVEFKLMASMQVRSLWADLEELEETTTDRSRTFLLQQVSCRISALERAACAVEADEVQAFSETLGRILASVTHERLAACPQLFGKLRQTLTKLTEALYAIDTETTFSTRAGQPTDETLVEFCTH